MSEQNLYRVKAFADRHRERGITLGSLRWQIFNRERNGMAESGAVVYKGRTCWIDEDRYFRWLSEGCGAA